MHLHETQPLNAYLLFGRINTSTQLFFFSRQFHRMNYFKYSLHFYSWIVVPVFSLFFYNKIQNKFCSNILSFSVILFYLYYCIMCFSLSQKLRKKENKFGKETEENTVDFFSPRQCWIVFPFFFFFIFTRILLFRLTFHVRLLLGNTSWFLLFRMNKIK